MMARGVAERLQWLNPPFGPLGGDQPFSLYVSQEPETMPDVVTVYDTGGPQPSLIASTGSVVQPSIQVRVKSRNYAEGMDVAWVAWGHLTSELGEEYPLGCLAHWVPSGNPQYIGRAEDDNCLFVVNFTGLLTLN